MATKTMTRSTKRVFAGQRGEKAAIPAPVSKPEASLCDGATGQAGCGGRSSPAPAPRPTEGGHACGAFGCS